MKETVKINLHGQLFHLDNDAYECLKRYLDSLKTKFSSSPSDADEILEDIEARIAEILHEKLSDTKQVVSLSDIKEIISLLGTADEMESEEEEEVKSKSSKKKQGSYKTNKRFYRDPQNSILGGVASGIAAYFGIDPLWIRLLFVFLFFANLAGPVIYIILWFILPPAHTIAQRLEMQGKRVNINDIEDAVKNEYEKVKNNVRGFSKSQNYKRTQNTLLEIVEVVGKILIVFIKIFAVFIGLGLILALVSVITGVVAGSVVFLPWQLFQNWHLPLIEWQSYSVLSICILLVVAIPIIAIFSKIIKALFDIRSRNNFAIGMGATIWVIAFITLIVLLVGESNKGLFRQSQVSEYTLEVPKNKILHVRLKDANAYTHDISNFQVFNYKFRYDEYKESFQKKPKFELVESTDSIVELRIERNYGNLNVGKIPKNQYRLVDYSWQLNDTLLILDRYYNCDKEDAWRLPILKLTLFVPKGRTVKLDSNLSDLNRENRTERSYIRQDNWQREETLE